MQTVDAAVRFQTLDGVWETCGVDRLRGVSPEGLKMEANNWGADTASFDLKRDPGGLWPDIAAFTPVEIEVGGVLVWDGFISQTPTTESDGGSINVQCKGWQYHLDDDSFERIWVATKPSDWRDIREYQAHSPRIYRPGATVNIGDGSVVLGWPASSTAQQFTYAAIVFDAGPENTIAAAAVNWQVEAAAGATNLGSSANMKVYARASNSLTTLHSTTSIAINGVAMGGLGTQSGNQGGTFSTPSRYVLVGMQFEGTTNATTSDFMVKFTNLSLAYSTSNFYRATTTGTATSGAGQTSITLASAVGVAAGQTVYGTGIAAGTTVSSIIGNTLTISPATTASWSSGNALSFSDKSIAGPLASDIVKDCLPKAPLLDQSTGDVTSTSFNIPHFASIDGGKTPREYMDAANSYHNNLLKLNPGKKLLFRPRLTTPTVSIGKWGGSEFEDAAANSADEIYNKVIVEGTGPDGLPVRISRTASNLSLKGLVPIQVTGIPNADFNSVSNWSATPALYSTIATTTTNAISGTSGKWTLGNPGLSPTVGTAYSVTGLMTSGFVFQKGVTYTANIRMRSYSTAFFGASFYPQMTFGSATDYAVGPAPDYVLTGVGFTYTMTIAWTPTSDVNSSGVSLKLELDPAWIDSVVLAAGDYFILDDWTITFNKATLTDRRGFVRTKRLQVDGIVSSSVAAQLGDTFLASKLVTPFKGSVEVAMGGARDYLSGQTIHPSELLLEVGELMHFSHRIDPDTGSAGRDGYITAVSYDHDSRKASVAIDSERKRFESLLSRLAVVTNAKLNR